MKLLQQWDSCGDEVFIDEAFNYEVPFQENICSPSASL
ncbi:MAG: hypothetical protein BWX44_00903 [Spirochaetes bacterium ADurb.Bin001]|jgi:hypothetical protein|nr:MAG: hypothetical protein BWX44_00903 [Spirochaetes bacterium ADurb.Bin001]